MANRSAADRAALYNRLSNTPTSNSATTEQTQRLMEDQNDEKIDQLSIQIGTLKDDNRFLGDMDRAFSNTESLMGGTLKKLGTMMEQGGPKHMCMLITFVVVVFVLMYLLMTGKY
ncbi:hypothetical protein SPRG_00664 [Saprolegnia parasitica CBS 223.65]|uniref:t-SNARE coiled-coil homology domain-containing protein n=1 Tax=Saprolegnia parasitica (strain CBS 223.65) TaxID=695850 RepID=A0A067D7G0_SAPPC|nr:hypothetical protein SPRG_00664 [Saprolegnia parasitica CBS 223.65]KDO34601.1 hypothetical protein SPRG_00664 [Saprolegnia parasitica CBS 223.65]|eukprot:XP_012194278.1 hypothetical protein SPRG_00664 [Saprolegnia parasitica CBS 223.65]